MTATVREGWNWLAAAPRHVRGVRLLRIGLGLALVIRAVTEWRWAAVTWGPSGWALPDSAVVPRIGALAEVFSSDARVYAALAVVGGAGALLVWGRAPRVAALAALIPYWLLFNRTDLYGDGGDNLIRILLVYSLLLSDPRRRPGPMETWFHNLGVVLVLAQACLVYLSSGLAKASGQGWLDGTAVFVAAQDELLFGDAARAALRVPAVAVAATYGVLLMEMWYPVAIFSRMRRPFLVGVMVFHGLTVLEMGIVSFGVVMIAMNLFVLMADSGQSAWPIPATELERPSPGAPLSV
jgi:hypothetical protein